jgi:pimeloyl-ACP methyl ester carboxylesterase
MPSASFVSRYYASADGLRLHYRDYPGPPSPRLTVVCIPGLTRNARDFEDLAPHLAQRYRVLCVELRGRGLSEYARDPMSYVPPVYVRDVAALLMAAELRHVALIGTSLGGIISMILAATMPAKVLGAVINDIGPEINPAGLARIASYVGKARPIITWDEAAATIKLIDGEIYPHYTSDEDWLRMARRRFVEEPDGGLRPDYDLNISKPFSDSTAVVNLWPFFAALKRIPTLAIRGETSDLLSPEIFVQMKQAVPPLHQVTVPNRGHAPYLDEPAALNAIDDFLSNLPASLDTFTTVRRKLAAILFMIGLKIQGIA